MKNKLLFIYILTACLVLNINVFSMNCHSGNEEDHSNGKEETSHSKHESGIVKEKELNIKESFYETIYTCPMHPDIKTDNPGKCPECNMKLEKKEVLMTFACPEENCEYQKAKPGTCPVHDKDLIKSEIKEYCPDCGAQIDSDKLIKKPVIKVKKK